MLGALSAGGVELIIVGGLAAIAHGASRRTQDIDVVYDREAESLGRIERALAPLSEVGGAGSYSSLRPGAVSVDLFGRRMLVIGLRDLIAAKRAAGRPKDLEVLAELELLFARD